MVTSRQAISRLSFSKMRIRKLPNLSSVVNRNVSKCFNWSLHAAKCSQLYHPIEFCTRNVTSLCAYGGNFGDRVVIRQYYEFIDIFIQFCWNNVHNPHDLSVWLNTNFKDFRQFVSIPGLSRVSFIYYDHFDVEQLLRTNSPHNL